MAYDVPIPGEYCSKEILDGFPNISQRDRMEN
jgi:hypothetical protein